MESKQLLSWKFLLPFGIIWLIIFDNSFIGQISLLIGIIDGMRIIFKNFIKARTIELKTKNRIKELGLDKNEDWQKYYEIRNEEERKIEKLEEEITSQDNINMSNYCCKCGNKLDSDSKFCAKCGTKI